MRFEFGLLGDSSLYTKRRTKKKTKTYTSQALRPMIPGKQLKDETCAGGGVEEFNTCVDSSGHDFEILGVSYFGNEHTEHPMNEVKHLEKWRTLFGLLRQHVKKRVAFFMGGYAAKYGYGRVYDNNMKIIRRWIRDVGGFECRTDFDKNQTELTEAPIKGRDAARRWLTKDLEKEFVHLTIVRSRQMDGRIVSWRCHTKSFIPSFSEFV